LASDLQLNDNIRFLGFLEDSCDVTGHMKASRVFVLPSTREGFGMVVLEANACGLPVITIEHPHNAAGELIKNGYNGYTCQLNAEDISSRIVTLLSKGKKETSTRCIEYSRQYDWKNIIDRVEEFYSGIIQKSRPGK
jgi:L-malate glycosyltransferase